MTAAFTRAEMRDAIRGLRGRRRAQRLRHIDWVDAVYRAYVVGISVTAALVTIAAVVGDTPVGAGGVRAATEHGAAIAGLVVALLVALGMRSGAHGGPLAFEAADVQHVLLAPVDRGLVIRAGAIRQLRGVVSAGVLAGALLGVIAAPRFPGSDHGAAQWVLAGIAFGILAALAAWGSALVSAATRMSQLRALLVGVVLVGWSLGDWVGSVKTSPATWAGEVGLWPLTGSLLAIAGVAVVGVIVTVGLRGAHRQSLEPVLRRAQLVSALRFAATVQDLRAVITLRRQLTHELARSRPWFTVPRGPAFGRAGWRRDWQGIARWPSARIVRVVALTIAGGASCGAGVRGITPLFAVAALCTYVIALDVAEGLAQEVDHPDRGTAVPMRSGDLYISHLAAPAAVTGIIGILGSGVGIIVASLMTRPHGVHAVSPVVALAVVIALVVAVPAAAGISIYLGRPDRDLAVAMLHPGLVAAQQVAPLIIVALAFIPLIVAREVDPPTQPIQSAFAAAMPTFIVAFGIATFLRSRRADTE
ncbi:MAG: hypothetical protein ABJC79_01715 [Acidimicrobiia bacterium]